ncbi:MAG: hypothetical protein ACI9LT_001226 [Pseudoalteromonas distincta]|jgi:hypothetical protein
MSSTLLLLLGSVVLLLAAWDVFITTLTLRGGGPVVRRATRLVWSGLLALHRWGWRPGLLSFGGGVAVALSLGVWVILLAAGWGLIFAGLPGAVVDGSSGAPADLLSRLYFAGFNLFTLGVGDYRPSGPLAQALTVAASASGLLGITLAITYLGPVASGGVSRRALAGEISLLGQTPDEIIEAARAQGADRFAARLEGLAPAILKMAEQHLAYPVLSYFHSPQPRLALPLRLAGLYEALLALKCGQENHAKVVRDYDAVLEAIEIYVRRLGREAADGKTAPEPQATDLCGLAADSEPSSTGRDAAAITRRRLCAMVERDGWTWRAVSGDAAEGPLPRV